MIKVIVLVGSKGSGKTRIQSELLKVLPNSSKIVTTTTREARDGEVNGESYFFISKVDFEREIRSDSFVEYKKRETLDGGFNYYGTGKYQLDVHSSKSYVIVLDLDGLKNLRDYIGGVNIFSIYVDAKAQLRLERCLSRKENWTNPEIYELCSSSLMDRDMALYTKYNKVVVNNSQDDLRKNIKELQIDIDSWMSRSK